MELAIKVELQEQVVDALVREIKSRRARRLRDGLCTAEYVFVLTACERTADHCSSVTVEMLQVADGKLEAHDLIDVLYCLGTQTFRRMLCFNPFDMDLVHQLAVQLLKICLPVSG